MKYNKSKFKSKMRKIEKQIKTLNRRMKETTKFERVNSNLLPDSARTSNKSKLNLNILI